MNLGVVTVIFLMLEYVSLCDGECYVFIFFCCACKPVYLLDDRIRHLSRCTCLFSWPPSSFPVDQNVMALDVLGLSELLPSSVPAHMYQMQL